MLYVNPLSQAEVITPGCMGMDMPLLKANLLRCLSLNIFCIGDQNIYRKYLSSNIAVGALIGYSQACRELLLSVQKNTLT